MASFAQAKAALTYTTGDVVEVLMAPFLQADLLLTHSGLCDVLGREIVQAVEVMASKRSGPGAAAPVAARAPPRIFSPGLSVWKRQWNQLQS